MKPSRNSSPLKCKIIGLTQLFTGAFVSVLQELVGHAAVDRVRGDVGGGGPGARHLQAELYQQGNCIHNIVCIQYLHVLLFTV